MPITKECPVCGNTFETYPSVNKITCSFKCKALKQWNDPLYRKHMSEIHKGQSTWLGKHHTQQTILKMRQVKLKHPYPLLKQNGYIYVYSPDHPNQINGRIPEQVLIAEDTLGRKLKPNEVVHHINGVKTDNRKSNLLICDDRYHRRLHAKMKGFGTLIQSNPQRDLETGRYKAYEERV